MESKRRYVKGLMQCAGICGRTLRPSYLRAEEAPGTVQRHARGLCKYCFRREDPTPVKGEGKMVRPCTQCGHPTRSQKAKAAAFPGTRLRIGELCRNCDSACVTVSEERANYVRGELEAYLRSRGRLTTTFKGE